MRIPRRDARSLGGIGAAGAVGFVLVFSVALGAGGGYLLDRWLHTEPYLMAVGLLLGAAAGFVRVAQIADRWSDR